MPDATEFGRLSQRTADQRRKRTGGDLGVIGFGQSRRELVAIDGASRKDQHRSVGQFGGGRCGVRCAGRSLGAEDSHRGGQLDWLAEHLHDVIELRFFRSQLHDDGSVEHVQVGDENSLRLIRTGCSRSNRVRGLADVHHLRCSEQRSLRLDDQNIPRQQRRVGERRQEQRLVDALMANEADRHGSVFRHAARSTDQGLHRQRARIEAISTRRGDLTQDSHAVVFGRLRRTPRDRLGIGTRSLRRDLAGNADFSGNYCRKHRSEPSAGSA